MANKATQSDIWQVLLNLFEQWYFFAVLSIFGAVIGFAVSFFFPPQYEAVALISVSVNYDRAVPISTYGTDLILGNIGSVISSDEVFQSVLAEYEKEDRFSEQPLDLSDFARLTAIERKGSRWELKLRGEDPDQLVWLVNTWMEEAESAFRRAYAHAVRAENLEDQMELVNQQIAEIMSSSIDQNSGDNLIEALEQELSLLEMEFAEEVILSKGLTTFIPLNRTREAHPGLQPVIHQRGEFILVGCLLGTIVALAAALISFKLSGTGIAQA